MVCARARVCVFVCGRRTLYNIYKIFINGMFYACLCRVCDLCTLTHVPIY